VCGIRFVLLQPTALTHTADLRSNLLASTGLSLRCRPPCCAGGWQAPQWLPDAGDRTVRRLGMGTGRIGRRVWGSRLRPDLGAKR